MDCRCALLLSSSSWPQVTKYRRCTDPREQPFSETRTSNFCLKPGKAPTRNSSLILRPRHRSKQPPHRTTFLSDAHLFPTPRSPPIAINSPPLAYTYFTANIIVASATPLPLHTPPPPPAHPRPVHPRSPVRTAHAPNPPPPPPPRIF